jgi:hypothetical protein
VVSDLKSDTGRAAQAGLEVGHRAERTSVVSDLKSDTGRAAQAAGAISTSMPS